MDVHRRRNALKNVEMVLMNGPDRAAFRRAAYGARG
jgi:hypothetical protein